MIFAKHCFYLSFKLKGNWIFFEQSGDLASLHRDFSTRPLKPTLRSGRSFCLVFSHSLTSKWHSVEYLHILFAALTNVREQCTCRERYGYLRVPSLMTRKFSSSYRCALCSYWNKVLSLSRWFALSALSLTQKLSFLIGKWVTISENFLRNSEIFVPFSTSTLIVASLPRLSIFKIL